MTSWIIRMVKGMFLGAGFILPGMSGGALAVVFGLYERIINFLADIRKSFRRGFPFFLPVGIGGILGIFIFANVLNFFFGTAEVQLIWFFIGCIIGTLPLLWRKAGERGRGKRHLVALTVSLVGVYAFLTWIDRAATNGIPLNFWTWVLSGGILGLVALVPGFAASNILIFLGVYAPMMQAIAEFEWTVIVPVVTGGVLAVLLFAKAMKWALEMAHGLVFHVIIGLMVASALLIVPLNYGYIGFGGIIALISAVLGIVIVRFISKFEN